MVTYKASGTLMMSDITDVIKKMDGLVNNAEAAYKSSGTTLNNFFK